MAERKMQMEDLDHVNSGFARSEMEINDSRKRPLDEENDSGMPKRSNQGAGDSILLKVLVPSVAAGAIIGKGGETISHIQKETGAVIKMSKANDYYPGTTERVCLITGSPDAVRNVHSFVAEKIREKPDPNPKLIEGETKINYERHKQVKIIIPNSTAGMVIGKAGNYIKHIKDESGAYVQISQKSKDMNLPERCVTIAGDPEQTQKAVDLIIEKIVEDPQSSSCPNISYADYKGPVASANPTGSPFAQTPGAQAGPQNVPTPSRVDVQGAHSGPAVGPANLFNSLTQLNLSGQGVGIASNNSGGSSMALENLKATLRGSGYTEQAVEDISSAMCTLANYGFLGLGLGLGGLSLGPGPGIGAVAAATIASAQQQNQQQQHIQQQQQQPPQQPQQPQQPLQPPHGQQPPNMGPATGGIVNFPAASGGGMLGGQVVSHSHSGVSGGGSILAGSIGAVGSAPGDANPPVFGPMGSTTTTMAGGDTGEVSSLFNSTAGFGGSSDRFAGAGDSVFGSNLSSSNSGFHCSSIGGNQNSFGLGTNMGMLSNGAQKMEEGSEATKKEIEIGEHIVGVIIGPGGRDIVELQRYTGANIQISKKGVFVPGTRNRVVTVTGTPSAVQRAQYLIQQRISQEEVKRARQSTQQVQPMAQ